MSFKNYNIKNFSENQGLSYQDLNDLAINDVILYNKIYNMPRGIIAFKEIRGPHGSFNTFNNSTASIDDNETSNLKMIRENVSTVFKLSFTVESLRLLKFSFYSSYFRNSLGSYFVTATSPGNVRGAFFIEESAGDKYMLNSTYKTSPITNSSPHGSLSMSYIGAMPAGTHSLKVGFKYHKASIQVGDDGSSASIRPTQLFVEDLGSFIAAGAEIENEL